MKYNKVYVIVPYNYSTGGCELAHQLVDYLRNKGQESYVVYVTSTHISDDQSVNPSYSAYNIETISTIDDSEENLLVLPEVFFEYVHKYTKIQIACWWMSVDNYYKKCALGDALKFNTSTIEKLRLLKRYVLNRSSFLNVSLRDLFNNDSRIIHFYQSHYAQYHLYSKGFSNVLPLSDYINVQFSKNVDSKGVRENIILYNPAKGFKFTKKIIGANAKFKFVALKGLSREELTLLMQKAKLYIDFGHFPGKDRLSREAVLNGCCVITGKLGASGFFEDVPLKQEYKFDVKSSNICGISDRIDFIMNNYEKCINDFVFYKNRIENEQSCFYREIDSAFNL